MSVTLYRYGSAVLLEVTPSQIVYGGSHTFLYSHIVVEDSPGETCAIYKDQVNAELMLRKHADDKASVVFFVPHDDGYSVPGRSLTDLSVYNSP